jgi:hypothetical protein
MIVIFYGERCGLHVFVRLTLITPRCVFSLGRPTDALVIKLLSFFLSCRRRSEDRYHRRLRCLVLGLSFSRPLVYYFSPSVCPSVSSCSFSVYVTRGGHSANGTIWNAFLPLHPDRRDGGRAGQRQCSSSSLSVERKEGKKEGRQGGRREKLYFQVSSSCSAVCLSSAATASFLDDKDLARRRRTVRSKEGENGRTPDLKKAICPLCLFRLLPFFCFKKYNLAFGNVTFDAPTCCLHIGICGYISF